MQKIYGHIHLAEIMNNAIEHSRGRKDQLCSKREIACIQRFYCR